MIQDAEHTLRQIINNGGNPLPNFVSKSFGNREGKLPITDSSGIIITYTEHDVYPQIPNQKRGVERIIIGSDGSYYYTTDHYNSFQPIQP